MTVADAPSAPVDVSGFAPVWDLAALDAVTETVVSRVLIDKAPARRVAADLAAQLYRERPDLPALALALPFTLAAAAIDEMLGGGAEARQAAADAWRAAALIGAEALALRANGSDLIGDLARHWQSGDELFG